MPSVLDLIKSLAPVAAPAASAAIQRRGLGQAVNSYTAGLNTASGQAQSTAQRLQQLYAPWQTAGQNNLDAIQKGLGPDGEFSPYGQMFKPPSPGEAGSDPGFQFTLAEGNKAIEAARRAMGTRFSGGAVKQAVEYNTGQANTHYNDVFTRNLQTHNSNENTFRQDQNDRFNRLKSITDTGFDATKQSANAQLIASQQLQDLEQEKASAIASGNMGKANAISGLIDDVLKGGGLDKLAGLAGGGLGTATLAAPGTPALSSQMGSLSALAKGMPSIASVAAGAGGLGTAALAAPGTAALSGQMASLAALTQTPGFAAAGTAAGLGGGTAATGLTGALGLGGGSGLLGLGAATIPVVGGIIAGGLLLANHYVGAGRKQADKLTGEGGLQRAFEYTLRDIDNAKGYTPAQKWTSKTQAYDELEKRVLEFAGKGKNQHKVAVQMFDEISHLFGRRNPLK